MCEVGEFGSILSHSTSTFPRESMAIRGDWLPFPPASTNLAPSQPVASPYRFDQIEPSNSTHMATAAPSALLATMGKIACNVGSLPTSAGGPHAPVLDV